MGHFLKRFGQDLFTYFFARVIMTLGVTLC